TNGCQRTAASLSEARIQAVASARAAQMPGSSGGGMVLGASLNIPNSSMLGRDGSSSVVFVLRAGRAARNSTTVDIAYGAGYGRAFNAGKISGEALAVPVRQVHSINWGTGQHEMFTGATFELSADVFANQLGLQGGGSIGGFTVDMKTDLVNTVGAYMYAGPASFGFNAEGRDLDFVIGIGKELYFFVGGGAGVNFNGSEFVRQWNTGRR
ncbi:MAG: hypothetical protein FWC70_02625, partial [Defluviitaleaceae bacterium]|nr:hypothetical protein [Defluviitaleaceae bacterium]